MKNIKPNLKNLFIHIIGSIFRVKANEERFGVIGCKLIQKP